MVSKAMPKRHSGARAEARKETRVARRIAKSMPADVRAFYVEKYQGVAEDAFRRLLTGSDHVCEKCNCCQPNHQAVRMFLEMAGAVGTANTLIVNVLSKFGVKDEAEAQHLITQGRQIAQLADVPVSVAFEESMDAVVLCIREQPELLAKAKARLESMSGAETLEGL